VDDLLNGNVTLSGTTFFTGLNTLSNELSNLNANLNNINNNFSDFTTTGAGSASDTLLTDLGTAKSNVQQIPDTSSPYQLVLAYQTPIDSSTGTTDSTFKVVLGDYSNSSSLVGAVYTAINAIYTSITQMRTDAASFSSTWNSVGAAVSSIQSQISSITSSITSVDSNLEGALGNVKKAGDNGNVGLQAFYGVFIGFGFFALLGTLLTACCDKYGCRYLMYFSCFFLFIAGLIGFFIAVLISIFIPAVTWGCSFLDVTLASQAGFNGTPAFTQPTWAPSWDPLSRPSCPSACPSATAPSLARSPLDPPWTR
jgi:uncharacterized protein YukE